MVDLLSTEDLGQESDVLTEIWGRAKDMSLAPKDDIFNRKLEARNKELKERRKYQKILRRITRPDPWLAPDSQQVVQDRPPVPRLYKDF